MTKAEYMKKLEENLASLPTWDRADALDYYENYFADANDDEKVIAELGTPEQLAATILEGRSKVPDLEPEETKDENVFNGQEAFSFDQTFTEDIKGLNIDVGDTEDIKFISGPEFRVKLNGFNLGSSDERKVFVDKAGVLNIISKRGTTIFSSAFINIINGIKNRMKIPESEILVYIPDNAELDSFKLNLGLGDCKDDGGCINAKNSMLNIGTGDVKLRKFSTNNLDAKCGMGDLELCGTIEGGTIKCGMGDVHLWIKGNPAEYSATASIGMGSFEFNGNKGTHTSKHFMVSIGMGDVNINIKD